MEAQCDGQGASTSGQRAAFKSSPQAFIASMWRRSIRPWPIPPCPGGVTYFLCSRPDSLATTSVNRPNSHFEVFPGRSERPLWVRLLRIAHGPQPDRPQGLDRQFVVRRRVRSCEEIPSTDSHVRRDCEYEAERHLASLESSAADHIAGLANSRPSRRRIRYGHQQPRLSAGARACFPSRRLS